MTEDELTAIETDAREGIEYYMAYEGGKVPSPLDEVPALVAEVRRLREHIVGLCANEGYDPGPYLDPRGYCAPSPAGR